MGKSTIPMAIFNSFLYVHQRVWPSPSVESVAVSSGHRVILEGAVGGLVRWRATDSGHFELGLATNNDQNR